MGDAFNWAWNKFSKNAAATIVPLLIYLLVIVVIGGVFFAMAFSGQLPLGGGDSSNSDASTGAKVGLLVLLALIEVVLLLAGFYMQAAFLSGCLDIADGKPVTIGSFVKPRNFGRVVLAALLITVGVIVGTVLCVIPKVIFGFLAYLTIPFVIDRSLSPLDALKASIATVRANVGGVLLSYLLQSAVVLVGELACGLGLIVAVPVASLIQVYTYRRLSGGRIVPLTV